MREIWERITVNVHGSGFTGVLVSDLPIKPILVFLVKEGVVPDREKAKKVLNEELGGVEEEGKISFSEWNRLFAKGVFKQALMRISETFLKQMSASNSKKADYSLR